MSCTYCQVAASGVPVTAVDISFPFTMGDTPPNNDNNKKIRGSSSAGTANATATGASSDRSEAAVAAAAAAAAAVAPGGACLAICLYSMIVTLRTRQPERDTVPLDLGDGDAVEFGANVLDAGDSFSGGGGQSVFTQLGSSSGHKCKNIPTRRRDGSHSPSD